MKRDSTAFINARASVKRRRGKVRAAITLTCLLIFFATVCPPANAQESNAAGDVRQSEARVPLAQVAVAFDVAGREALHGRLRTQTLAGGQ